ncbi:hypothetical protein [Flavobacterium psychrophilum]|uniref:hypothetical protein n=1 Tax=Flavobacterium psychrophilum TaxID=96345 RepID=UPI000B7C0BB5|nr:hypothetical protein [Flavobacterium psychrophilum]MCB6062082.1 hypothetical protein [Flavobacterium psychrophilum]MCB6088901.1 hypothetical protein [Flavobacterium psychrophilum]MCB6231869.1 hypothetical protein [Flavobacterium psychrophilum]MEB3380400.1 hypothetical protein [Flavobacterium psychrophilum]SNA74208.1 hypothetical protein DK095_400017 [Flavobacterium psychrophilum]
MKKIVLSISALLIIVSCKKNEVKGTVTEKTPIEIAEKKMDTITNFDRKYPFSDYKVELNKAESKAEIIFEDKSVELKEIQNEITEKYKNSKIDFAGNYILITKSCGGGCKTASIIDVRDGKVYNLPQLEDQEGNSYDSTINSAEYDNILTNKESRLLITFDTIGEEENLTTKTQTIIRTNRYWEWNENIKEFKLVKEFAEKFDRKLE